MKYELAKKLKDVGFPQHERLGIGHGDNFIRGEDGLLYSPTLSELIEACTTTDRVFSLFTRDKIWDKKWQAFLAGKETEAGHNGDGESFNECGYGETPEEAVANLFLELNQK